MKELAPQKYWDSVYDRMNQVAAASVEVGWRSKVKRWTRDYSNFLIWEVILPHFISGQSGLTLLEVGCAPGRYLINLHRAFGYRVYGVEYSDEGAMVTRANFESAGLDPNQIIKADFFNDQFERNYRGQFDAIFSRGFIEHYDDVGLVVQRHLDLIKSGGLVIISVPNLSGINYYLSRFFNLDSLLLHNTSIMNRQSFRSLFPADQVTELYCDYVGLFSFGLFNTNKGWKYLLHRALLLIQRPIDLILRTLFPDNVLKSRFTSPYLLFIGIKK